MKWIKHDTDANQDAKLQNVLLDYGLEGYGLYWYCIELIAGKVDKDNITFELEHDARIIARATGSTPQKVEEMMRYFVKIGLFENASGTITCIKLARRLDKSMTSNPEMRLIIDKLRGGLLDIQDKQNHDSVMTQSEKVMQDKTRLDNSKKNTSTGVDFSPVIQRWNEVANELGLQKILGVTSKRKTEIKNAYANYKKACKDFGKEPKDMIGFLIALIECANVTHTEFHLGGADRDKWKMNFDYLMQKKVIYKVTETGSIA